MKRARLWLGVALIVTHLMVLRSAIAQGPVKYVNVSYSLKSPITLHEPVIIHVTILSLV
jgi:hypothetical protein